MADLNGFNANDVDPASELDPIPAGKYLAMITDTEMKATKNGDGGYLQLTFQVLEGQYKGRLVWARLNLENSNETAVKIARAELSSICRATGVMTPKDSCELHNLPLTISVKLKKREDTDEPQNVIRGYAKAGTTNAPQQSAAGNGTPPWKRA